MFAKYIVHIEATKIKKIANFVFPRGQDERGLTQASVEGNHDNVVRGVQFTVSPEQKF